ncbi:hypothetical protein QYE76_067717 [Lolium multiflorum]|uniref:Uncharacterized protein n=1 Tax=Lolium multiflorum TaxID=4521 RepID=A0AAD8SD34_LOLMU|nr:hypothetical protein QYE76_067717 [Lolium multiflorum]
MRSRIRQLPHALWYDHTHHHKDFRHEFITWEHEVWWAIREKCDFQPSEDYDALDAAIEEEDEGGDDNEEMEDMASPTTVKLAVLVPDSYVEDAATAAALVQSRADEDAKWSWRGWTRSSNSRPWWRSTWRLCHRHHLFRRTRLPRPSERASWCCLLRSTRRPPPCRSTSIRRSTCRSRRRSKLGGQ